LLLCLTANAQQSTRGCYKPDHAPKKDKHLNCTGKNHKRQGLWKFYSSNGFLLSQIFYEDNRMIWSIKYYMTTGETAKISGTPPDSILNPKKKHRW